MSMVAHQPALSPDPEPVAPTAIRVPPLEPAPDIKFELSGGEVWITAAVHLYASVAETYPEDLIAGWLPDVELHAEDWLPADTPLSLVIAGLLNGHQGVMERLREQAEITLNERCTALRAALRDEHTHWSVAGSGGGHPIPCIRPVAECGGQGRLF